MEDCNGNNTETGSLTRSELSKLLCGGVDCPGIIKFRELGIGPLAKKDQPPPDKNCGGSSCPSNYPPSGQKRKESVQIANEIITKPQKQQRHSVSSRGSHKPKTETTATQSPEIVLGPCGKSKCKYATKLPDVKRKYCGKAKCKYAQQNQPPYNDSTVDENDYYVDSGTTTPKCGIDYKKICPDCGGYSKSGKTCRDLPLTVEKCPSIDKNENEENEPKYEKVEVHEYDLDIFDDEDNSSYVEYKNYRYQNHQNRRYTYASRISLSSVEISTDEDEDGNEDNGDGDGKPKDSTAQRRSSNGGYKEDIKETKQKKNSMDSSKSFNNLGEAVMEAYETSFAAWRPQTDAKKRSSLKENNSFYMFCLESVKFALPHIKQTIQTFQEKGNLNLFSPASIIINQFKCDEVKFAVENTVSLISEYVKTNMNVTEINRSLQVIVASSVLKNMSFLPERRMSMNERKGSITGSSQVANKTEKTLTNSTNKQNTLNAINDVVDNAPSINKPKKKKKSKSKFVFSAGNIYPGIKIGHKYCRIPGRNVPRDMGWLWNVKDKFCVRRKIRRGWRPGGVSTAVMKCIQDARREAGLEPLDDMSYKHTKFHSKKARPVDNIEYEVKQKPTLQIKKKDGVYVITMNPLKEPTSAVLDNEDPYINCSPLQFMISRKGDKMMKVDPNDPDMCDYYKDNMSSSDSELDIEFTPPAGMIDPDRMKKKPDVCHADTQYNVDDTTVVLMKTKSKTKRK